MSQVSRNILWLLGSQLATWAASLITVIVAPGLLGSSDFGALSYATGFVMFFTLVGGLGTSTFMSRAVARDHDIVGSYVWNGILFKIVLSVVLTGVALGTAYLLGNRGTTLTLIAIGCFGMVLHVVGEVSAGALFGLQRMAGVAVWSVAQVYVQTIVGVAVLALGWGVVAYSMVLVSASLLPVISQQWLIRPHLRGQRTVDFAIWRVLVTGGLPLMMLAFFNMIYGTVNVPILHFIAGEQQVGWYVLAVRWVGIPVFITAAVGSAFFPEFSKHGNPITAAFAPLVNRAIGIVLIVTLPAAVGIGLVADDLVRTFYPDGDFENSIVLIQILAVQMPITAMDTMLAHALVASDRLNPYLRISAAAAVLNPIACVIGINYMQDRYGNGAIGTALVMVATELFIMVGALRLRADGVMDRSTVALISRILVASAIMGAVVWALGSQPMLVQIVVGATTYVAAALAVRVVEVSDVRGIVARVLPIGKE